MELLEKLVKEHGYTAVFKKLQKMIDMEDLQAEDIKNWDKSRQWHRLSEHLESCISYCPQDY
jgi:hypothetical protein